MTLIGPPGPGRRSLLLSGAAIGEGEDPDRRHGQAAADPVPPASPPHHRGLLEHLAGAEVLGAARLPYSSNAVFILELDAPAPEGEGRLRAVYKPIRGERPLWDFPSRTLALREVATYELDCALGFDLVPPTVLRDGPAGPGSVQLFVTTGDTRPGRTARRTLERQLLAMAALDVLANNADRKSAHLLITAAGRLTGIDHGLTFLPYPRQRTVLLELGGGLLPRGVARAVQALQRDEPRREELTHRLGRLLTEVETRAFRGRLEELAADPVYPELDAWDGRPFEWW